MMTKTDGSKYYQEYKPDLFWQDYIECFWEFKISKEILSQANQVYLPDGSPQLIFVKNKSYERKFQDGRSEIINSAVIIPQRASAVRIIHEVGTELFGIRFKPYGLRCVINESMSEFKEMSCPLIKYFGKSDIREINTILTRNDINKKLIGIQKILIKHFRALPVNSKIKDIINFVNINHGSSIPELAKKFSMSVSSLEKLFNSFIGISAKNYMNIIRLNKSVRFYKKRSKSYPNLTSTGVEAEFYDQSHFIKDFKRISGITPGQYFRENNFFNMFLISSIEKKTDV